MAALGGGLVVIAEPSLLPRRAACRSRTTLPHRESVILSGTARSRLQGQRFHSIVLRSIRGRSPRKKGRTACSSSAVGDVDGEERNLGRIERKSSKGVLAAAVVTVALATGNRVLHKLALIPLKNYPFFLALFTTFGYVMVYFTILYFRYRAGNVTERMLSLPKRPYAVLGFLETISAVSGMAATAVLPGPLIPILSQTFLVWQLLLSYLVLGRRYRFNQVVGCLLVSAGVVTTVMSGTGPRVSLKGPQTSSFIRSGARDISLLFFLNSSSSREIRCQILVLAVFLAAMSIGDRYRSSFRSRIEERRLRRRQDGSNSDLVMSQVSRSILDGNSEDP